LAGWKFFRRYDCLAGDAYPNVKFIYYAAIHASPSELTLSDGQQLLGIRCHDRSQFRFANILGGILEDFIAAGLWPQSVDNF
jgi:hypothetical protein